MVIKAENYDEFVFALKEKLSSMGEEDKNSFFAQLAEKGSFEGQNVGQQLYVPWLQTMLKILMKLKTD